MTKKKTVFYQFIENGRPGQQKGKKGWGCFLQAPLNCGLSCSFLIFSKASFSYCYTIYEQIESQGFEFCVLIICIKIDID